MFDCLSLDLLKEICDRLDIKAEVDFSLLNSNAYIIHRRNLQRLLTDNLSNPTDKTFGKLIECIIKSEKLGYAVINDNLCKHILIENRSKELPHWILSIPECQPNLINFILKNDDYRNSLNREEFEFLKRNYPEIDAFIKKNTLLPPQKIEEAKAPGFSIEFKK